MGAFIGGITQFIFKILAVLKIKKYLINFSRFNMRAVVPRIVGIYQYFFRVKKGKITSISNRNIANHQFKMINQQFKRYDGWHSIRRFETIVERGFFTQFFMLPYHIVTSEVILLEDGCKLLKYLKRDKSKRIIIQIWHATGAYKKFGLALSLAEVKGIDDAKEIAWSHTYDYFVDPGLKFRKNYYEAFNKGCQVIEGAMNPRIDLLFNEEYVEMKIKQMYSIFPELNDKKILLYTPTFRGFAWAPKTLKNGKVVQLPVNNGRKNTDAFMDFDTILDGLSDEWVVVLKKHPSMRGAKYKSPSDRNKSRFYDMSANVNTLMLISDLMVCDYSSTFFEMAMLGKPIVFFANDINEYLDDRGFFYEFREFVPGEISENEQELIASINRTMNADDPGKRSREFVQEYFGEINSNNAEIFADFIANYINRDGVIVEKKRDCVPFWTPKLKESAQEFEKWVKKSKEKYKKRIEKIHNNNETKGQD